jgi:hypothetical protein
LLANFVYVSIPKLTETNSLLLWICTSPSSRFLLSRFFRRRRSGAASAREQRVTVPWRVPLTQQQLSRLLEGFIPNDMDDKWLVRVLPPDTSDSSTPVHHATVWFLRSWTGFMVAELAIEIYNSSGGEVNAVATGNGIAVGGDKNPAPAGRITTLTLTPSHPEGDDVNTVTDLVRRVSTGILGIDLAPEESVVEEDDKVQQVGEVTSGQK